MNLKTKMRSAIPLHCWSLRLWHRNDLTSASKSFSRRLCVAAVITAFVIGIAVGILVPIYVPNSTALPLLPYHRIRHPGATAATYPLLDQANLQAFRGNATHENTSEGILMEKASSKNETSKLRAGTPHGALSWPSSELLHSPLISETSIRNADANQKYQTAQNLKQKLTSETGNGRKNITSLKQSQIPVPAIDLPKNLLVLLKKRPSPSSISLTDLLLRTSEASGKQLGRPGVKSNGVAYPPREATLIANSSDLGDGAEKAKTTTTFLNPRLDSRTGDFTKLPKVPNAKAFYWQGGVVTTRPESPELDGLDTGKVPQIIRPDSAPKQGSKDPEDVARTLLKDSDLPVQQELPQLMDFVGWKGQSVKSLVDGVYWSDRVEGLLPEGFSQREISDWTSFAESATVVRVVEGCGRMQNRLLVFDNGTKSCCRYRQNNDQIQGEIFSFYLSQLLGLHSLPPASLGLLHGHEGQWRTVRGQVNLAQWNEQKPVVMTKFVDDLMPAYIPRHFRGEGPHEHRRLHPVPEDLAGLEAEEVKELAQWSDLVIFDYLTANLDRVVNNMYNKQWNPDMMSAPAHNLAKVSKTGLLVFLDNESGLLHGYRLLDKYESYHNALLQGLCIFRYSTAQTVLKLHYSGDVGLRLKSALMTSQPYMAEWLPLLPDKSVKILRERLARVAQQIITCENRFMNVSSATQETGSRDSDLYDSLTKPSVEYS